MDFASLNCFSGPRYYWWRVRCFVHSLLFPPVEKEKENKRPVHNLMSDNYHLSAHDWSHEASTMLVH